MDTQFCLGDMVNYESADVDHINDDVSDIIDDNEDSDDFEDHDGENQQDAQSLGISTPPSDMEDLTNDEKAVETDNQSSDKRAKGS